MREQIIIIKNNNNKNMYISFINLFLHSFKKREQTAITFCSLAGPHSPAPATAAVLPSLSTVSSAAAVAMIVLSEVAAAVAAAGTAVVPARALACFPPPS